MTSGYSSDGVDRDVRALLGLRSTAATVLVAAYVLTFLLLALSTSPGRDALWAELVAWLLVSAGAVAFVRTPGDPLPWGITVVLASVGPVATALVLSVVPVPIDKALQVWPLPASTAICAYMCLRGRTPAAWIGTVSCLVCCVVWAARTGQGAGYGLGMSAVNLAPLLMATFIGWTIRPAARDIFDLRDQTTIRVAAQAADTAVLEERDHQLRRLDTLARPLLEELSVATTISDGDRLACSLLEAHLRDAIRAPALGDPAIVTAARSARGRGVDVVLLDDGGMTTVSYGVRDRIHGAVVAALDAAVGGVLTIRVLPPGRGSLLTILHSDGDDVTRQQFGTDGCLLGAARTEFESR
ncbi:hypothetical protein [Rhodococcus sp. NPDC003348]